MDPRPPHPLAKRVQGAENKSKPQPSLPPRPFRSPCDAAIAHDFNGASRSTTRGAICGAATIKPQPDNPAPAIDVAKLSNIVKEAIDNGNVASAALEQHLLEGLKLRIDPDRLRQYQVCAGETVDVGPADRGLKLSQAGTLQEHGRQSIQQLATLIFLGKSLGMDDSQLDMFANKGIQYAARGPGITASTLTPGVSKKNTPDFRRYEQLLLQLMGEIANRREGGDDMTRRTRSPMEMDRIVGRYHADVIKTIVDDVKNASDGQLACHDTDSHTHASLGHEEAYARARNTYETVASNFGTAQRIFLPSTMRTTCMTRIVDLLVREKSPTAPDSHDDACTDSASTQCGFPASHRDSASLASSTPTPTPASTSALPSAPTPPIPVSGVATANSAPSTPPSSSLAWSRASSTPTQWHTMNGRSSRDTHVLANDEHLAAPLVPPTDKGLRNGVIGAGSHVLDLPKSTGTIHAAPAELVFSGFDYTEANLENVRNLSGKRTGDRFVVSKLKTAFCYDVDVRRRLIAIEGALRHPENDTATGDFAALQDDIFDRLTAPAQSTEHAAKNGNARGALDQFYRAVQRVTVPANNLFAPAMSDFIAKLARHA